MLHRELKEKLDALLRAGPVAFEYEYREAGTEEPVVVESGTVDFVRLAAQGDHHQQVGDKWVTSAFKQDGVHRQFQGPDSDEWLEFPEAGLGMTSPGLILTLYFTTEVTAEEDVFEGVIEADPNPEAFDDRYSGSVHETVAGLLRETKLNPAPFRFQAGTGTLTILGHTLRLTPPSTNLDNTAGT